MRDYELNSSNYFRVLNHLQKVSYPPAFTLVEQNGEMVFDPLILLDLHCMKCGQVNRVACDLWDSVGGHSRVCQLGGHVVSELFYEGEYHYFDADCTVGILFAKDNNDSIPSLGELSRGYSIDLTNFYIEQLCIASNPDYTNYYYSSFLNKNKLGDDGCLYYLKCADEEECCNKYYGWNYYSTSTAKDVMLNDSSYCAPDIPWIKEIYFENDKSVTITWDCLDADEDLMFYKVYISGITRGWNYANYYASDAVLEYMTELYSPNQWNKVGIIPDNSIEYITKENQISIKLIQGGVIYL